MEILLFLTLVFLFCSSNYRSQGFRFAFKAYILEWLIVYNTLYKMSLANDGRVSCLHAGSYHRLKNTGVVIGLMWIFSWSPTSVSSSAAVGELFQQAKAAGCARSRWMGILGACEWQAWQSCNHTWCWKPFLRGIVVNPKGCCCSFLACVHAWHRPVSFLYQCVLCISENLTAAEDYLNMNVHIIQRNVF